MGRFFTEKELHMTITTIVTFIFVLAVIGAVLYFMNNHMPMQPWVKALINIIAILSIVYWVLSEFGLIRASLRLQ